MSDYIETSTDGTALSLMEVVSEDDDLFEAISTRERATQVRVAVAKHLHGRELQVISLRYGLNGHTPQRQREVAKILGISRSYVSRIEKKALEKLYAALSDETL